jgi:hypothetical protein
MRLDALERLELNHSEKPFEPTAAVERLELIEGAVVLS